MFWETDDPTRSRNQFITRPYLIFAALGSIFIVAVFLSSWFSSVISPGRFLPMAGFDCVALAAAFLVYIVWERQPFRLACPGCDKILLTNTPWFCPVCRKPNLNTAKFPFINRCEHCPTEPKAFRCRNPKCKKLIFLTEDEDGTNYAFALNSPDEVIAEEKRAHSVRTQQELREDQQHEISVAKGDVTLATLQQRHKSILGQLKEKEKKSPLESKRNSLGEFFDSNIAAEQAAREQKAKNAEDCKDDPKERKRRDRVVEFWLERELAGENEENE